MAPASEEGERIVFLRIKWGSNGWEVHHIIPKYIQDKLQRCLAKSWDLDATPVVLENRADHMYGSANSLHKKIDEAGLSWRDLDNLGEFPENQATADLILTRLQAAYAGRPELQRVIEVWRVTIE